MDELDTLRGSSVTTDTGRPPTRDQLLKLHGVGVEVLNNGVQHRARAFFDLAQEVEDGVFDMLDAVIKLHRWGD